MSGHSDPFSGKGTGMTTSFILFLKEKRDQIVRENPHFQQKEIASLGGKLWRELPQVQKDLYKQRADVMFREKRERMAFFHYQQAGLISNPESSIVANNAPKGKRGRKPKNILSEFKIEEDILLYNSGAEDQHEE